MNRELLELAITYKDIARIYFYGGTDNKEYKKIIGDSTMFYLENGKGQMSEGVGKDEEPIEDIKEFIKKYEITGIDLGQIESLNNIRGKKIGFCQGNTNTGYDENNFETKAETEIIALEFIKKEIKKEMEEVDMKKELKELLEKYEDIKLLNANDNRENNDEVLVELSFECGDIEIHFEDQVVTDIKGSGNFFSFKNANQAVVDIIKFMENDYLLREVE